jgi:hypothetical protein
MNMSVPHTRRSVLPPVSDRHDIASCDGKPSVVAPHAPDFRARDCPLLHNHITTRLIVTLHSNTMVLYDEEVGAVKYGLWRSGLIARVMV